MDRLETGNQVAAAFNSTIAEHYAEGAQLPELATTLSTQGLCFNLELVNESELEKVAPIIAEVLAQHDIPSATFIVLAREYLVAGQTLKKEEGMFMLGAYRITADARLEELDLQQVMQDSQGMTSSLE